MVSQGEIRKALAAGVAPERIVFSGVGKTREEMAFALNYGEVRPALMQTLLDNVKTNWSRH